MTCTICVHYSVAPAFDKSHLECDAGESVDTPGVVKKEKGKRNTAAFRPPPAVDALSGRLASALDLLGEVLGCVRVQVRVR